MCRAVRDPVIYTAIGLCALATKISPFLEHTVLHIGTQWAGPYGFPVQLGSGQAVNDPLGPLGLYVQSGTRPSYLHGYRPMRACYQDITISGAYRTAHRNPVGGAVRFSGTIGVGASSERPPRAAGSLCAERYESQLSTAMGLCALASKISPFLEHTVLH